MGKTRKQTAVWMVFLQGILLAVGLYLLLVLLAALLSVKGVLPERSVFAILAAAGVLSSMAGGIRCVAASPWGRLPSALACAAGFAAVLVVVGLLCWEGGVTWTGRGGVLLLCTLAGGVLAGFFGGKRGRRMQRKKARK